MKKVFAVLCFMLIVSVLYSCHKNKEIYIDTDNATETESFDVDDDVIAVPYSEANGVKIVFVKINGVGFNMIFDTGCSATLISPAEAWYLLQKGLLTKDDVVGYTRSMVADGTIEENTVINLKEVSIDGKITCYNVKATVSNSISAPLLLGNEVLNRVASYEIDNEREMIYFKVK